MKNAAADRPAPRVLIVGYGSVLRRDDGVGPFIVDALAEQISDPAVEFLSCHQLLPEHTDPVSRCQRVIFIDAAADQPAGQVRCRRLRALTVLKDVGHFFTPEGLLGMSDAVYGRYPRALLFGVGTESFDIGEGLTPKVREAAERLRDRLARRIPVWVRKMAKSNLSLPETLQ